MKTKPTSSILYWLNLSKKKDTLAPIFARVTVNGRRAEISLSRQSDPNPVTIMLTGLKEEILKPQF